jgi:hypothetical protein
MAVPRVRRPLSTMSAEERERTRKEIVRLFKKAREENRRKGQLLDNRELDREIRFVRGG